MVACCPVSQAIAEIVSGSNVRFSGGFATSPAASGYEFEIQQYAEFGRDYTVAWLQWDASVLSCTTALDEGSDWYLASYGDDFWSGTLSTFPLLTKATDTGWESYPRFISANDFYLAFNTGNSDAPWLPRNVYGWVHLAENDGKLSMLGNAVSYDSGIVVGTLLSVPEPTALGLAVIGLSLRFVGRRQLGPRGGASAKPPRL